MRNAVTLVLTIVGLVLIALPLIFNLIGLDFTPGFGLIQMITLVFGLTLLTLAGFLYLQQIRGEQPRSLQADIGIRLGATGLVFAYVTGFSDLVGIGTHIQPEFVRPFFGPLQLIGLGVSVLTILTGMWLYYSSRGIGNASYFEFLALDKESEG